MRQTIWLLAAATLVLLVCGLLMVGRLPLGIAGEWEWGRINPPVFWPGVAAASFLYAAVVAFGSSWITRKPWVRRVAPLALVLAAFALTMALQQFGYGLGKWPFVLYSPSSSGYYTAARTEVKNASDFLEHYAEFQASHGPFHLGTHPPGLVLMHYGALRFCEANPGITLWLLGLQPQEVRDGFRDVTVGAGLPAADQASIWLVALMTQLASALTVLPIYVLARRGCSPAAAWCAAAMWPLVPAVTVFMPKSDLLYPLLAATGVVLAVSGRTVAERLVSGAAAGLALVLGMFLSFGVVAVVPLILIAIGLVDGIRSRDSWIAWGVRLSGLAAGFLIPTAIFGLATGHNLLATWLACYRKHATFYDVMHRSYRSWVGFNLAEFAVALGIPLAVAAVVGTGQLMRSMWTSSASSCEPPSASMPNDATARTLRGVIVAWWLTLFLLNLSGKNLGEVARLWIFLMPFAIPAAAVAIESSGHLRWAAFVLLSLQVIQTIVFVASVQGFVDPHSVRLSASVTGGRSPGCAWVGDRANPSDPVLAH